MNEPVQSKRPVAFMVEVDPDYTSWPGAIGSAISMIVGVRRTVYLFEGDERLTGLSETEPVD